MRRFTRFHFTSACAIDEYLQSGLVSVVVTSCICFASAQAQTHPAAAGSLPSRIEKGRYLTEAVMQCFDCHSERDETKAGWPAKIGLKGAGQSFGASGPFAPNITPDPETGVGRWTDHQLARAIRDGIAPDGTRLIAIMPYSYFRFISDDDLSAVIAYLRSIPPVKRRWRRNPRPATAVRDVPIEGVSIRDLSRSAEHGEYLVHLAGCASCHTPVRNGSPIRGMEFAGGLPLSHLKETAVSTNITVSVSGIGYYDQTLFTQAMRTGMVRARKLSPIMPWAVFRNMTDADLASILTYLGTLRPVDHSVDNQDPPTPCKKCGNRHGLGSMN